MIIPLCLGVNFPWKESVLFPFFKNLIIKIKATIKYLTSIQSFFLIAVTFLYSFIVNKIVLSKVINGNKRQEIVHVVVVNNVIAPKHLTMEGSRVTDTVSVRQNNNQHFNIIHHTFLAVCDILLFFEVLIISQKVQNDMP